MKKDLEKGKEKRMKEELNQNLFHRPAWFNALQEGDLVGFLNGPVSAILSTWVGRWCLSLLGIFVDLILLVRYFYKDPWGFFKWKDHSPVESVLEKIGTHSYITTKSGVKFHIVRQGVKGPLLLFVHGFPEFWYCWRHQMAEFSKEYQCVAIDLRGYGQSDKPVGKSNYELSILVNDIKEIVEELGFEQFTLVAHDWGGIIAWRFAGMYPNMLKRLVVINGPHASIFLPSIRRIPQVFHSAYIYFFQLPFLPEIQLSVRDHKAIELLFRGAKSGLRNRHNITEFDIACYKHNLSRPGVKTCALNYYRALLDTDPDEYKYVHVPTLVVWGDDDMFLPLSQLSGLDELVSGLKIEIIKGCGHWTPHDFPQRLNAIMKEYFATAASNPSSTPFAKNGISLKSI